VLLESKYITTSFWSREWSPFLQMTNLLKEFPQIMFPFYAVFTAAASYHSFYGLSLCVSSVARRRRPWPPTIGGLESDKRSRLTVKKVLYWCALGATIVAWNVSLLGFAGKLYPLSSLPPSATPDHHFLLVFFRKIASLVQWT